MVTLDAQLGQMTITNSNTDIRVDVAVQDPRLGGSTGSRNLEYVIRTRDFDMCRHQSHTDLLIHCR